MASSFSEQVDQLKQLFKYEKSIFFFSNPQIVFLLPLTTEKYQETPNRYKHKNLPIPKTNHLEHHARFVEV